MIEKRDSHPSGNDGAGSRATDAVIREAVAWIVREVHPLQIILFGSAARGDQNSQSDVDLLVVMPDGTHKRQTAQRLYRKLRGLAVPVDVLVTTQADLDRHRDNPGLIYRTILQEGRTLHGA